MINFKHLNNEEIYPLLISENNYLVYAPFSQPDDNENYLADLTHYAVPFSADKIEMIGQELGISPEFYHLLKKYSLFF